MDDGPNEATQALRNITPSQGELIEDGTLASMSLTPHHAKYFAYELTRRLPADSNERLAGAVASAQVDLNPWGQGAGYEPDFVVETGDRKYLVETKAANQIDDPEVLAKALATTTWCRHASAYAAQHGGKAWVYLLIPDPRWRPRRRWRGWRPSGAALDPLIGSFSVPASKGLDTARCTEPSADPHQRRRQPGNQR